MNFKRIFFLGLFIFIITWVYSMVTCGWLFSWIYKLPPNIWKSEEAVKHFWNLLSVLFFGVLNGWIFVFVYAVLYKGLPLGGIRKGLIYGSLVWLVGAFSGIPSMGFYMNIAKTVLVYWTIQSLVLNWILGVIVGLWYYPHEKIDEEKGA